MNAEQSHELNAKLDELQQAVDQLKQERYHIAKENAGKHTITGTVLTPPPYRTAADAGCPEVNTPLGIAKTEAANELSALCDTIVQCNTAAAMLEKRLEFVLVPPAAQEADMPKEKIPMPRSPLACSIMQARLDAGRVKDTITDIIQRLQV